ncbi:hypothetical protein [Roseibium aggregatum]|uniref:hypothetical protein n=1 Tax=Roseibium aggregatum TaxID=187304 RepID=UPI001A92115E|nr:hypothetical protein [Roseibium aggregatum]
MSFDFDSGISFRSGIAWFRLMRGRGRSSAKALRGLFLLSTAHNGATPAGFGKTDTVRHKPRVPGVVPFHVFCLKGRRHFPCHINLVNGQLTVSAVHPFTPDKNNLDVGLSMRKCTLCDFLCAFFPPGLSFSDLRMTKRRAAQVERSKVRCPRGRPSKVQIQAGPPKRYARMENGLSSN